MDKLKSIYFELDEEKIVTAITEIETPNKYCEVSVDVELDDVISFLDLDKYVMKYENGVLIVIKEIESAGEDLVTVEEMKEQIALAVSEVTETFTAIIEGMMPNE